VVKELVWLSTWGKGKTRPAVPVIRMRVPLRFVLSEARVRHRQRADPREVRPGARRGVWVRAAPSAPSCWNAPDERIALPSESIQQRPIIEVGASEHATDGCDAVSWQKPRQPNGHARIKDDAHWGRLRRAGFGLAYQGLPCEFEDGDRVFARDVGEVRKKLGELMSTLDVVNNRSYRHASTRKTGFATEAREARRCEGVREGHRRMDRVARYKVTGRRSCG